LIKFYLNLILHLKKRVKEQIMLVKIIFS